LGRHHLADRPEGFSVWAVFEPDTDYFGRREQVFMVNYRVDDLDAMLTQLRDAGAEVVDRVEESETGRFGWAVDPEGNRFELWQRRSSRAGCQALTNSVRRT